MFLLALDAGSATEAAVHWPYLDGRLNDPALEKMLLGQLRAAEGAHGKALEIFRAAHKQDPRRTGALLQAAAAAARGDRPDEAFKLLHDAGQADPARPLPHRTMTLFYLQPNEMLRGVERSVELAARATADRLSVPLYRGLVQFIARDRRAAEASLSRAATLDSRNGLSLSLLALLALERGEVRRGLDLSARALAASRQLALAHHARGSALLAQGREEEAGRSFQEALALSPSMLSAAVKLARIEAGAGERRSAIERLKKVIAVDPDFRQAKRALFEVELSARKEEAR